MARSIKANSRYNNFDAETVERTPRARREKLAKLDSKRQARKNERTRQAYETV